MRVTFILDEAASLGHLEAIDDALDKGRGFGLRLLFIYQNPAQLKKCFPNGQEMTLMANTSQIFFGVQENSAADYVSTRLGEETITVDSGNSNYGTSHQSTFGRDPQTSKNYSSGSTSSWALQARRLLKPEEVIALSPRTAITFQPGVPPIRTTLLRWYEEKNLGKRSGWFARAGAAFATLIASAALCAASIALSVGLTVGVSGNSTAPSTSPYLQPSQPYIFGEQPPDVPAYNVFQRR